MGIDKILVAIGEPFIRKSIEECLRLRRYAVHGVGLLVEAERLMQREVFDLLLLETELPDGAGLDLLEQLLSRPKRPLVALMGPGSAMETMAHGVRLGAFDYLLKPFGLNQVELLVRKAEAFQQMVKVNQYLSAAAADAPPMLGQHPSMVRLQIQIRKVAPTDATLLIEGEVGTGKTFLARQIHRESARAGAPYLEVDCRHNSEKELGSRIFGHERGAYSGATERREGRLELANGGTLLLEAVDALPGGLQDRLLRFLLDRDFERLGSNRRQKADVRLLVTVRENLLARVENGHFQENLFYRLNVLPLRIPPLRERGEDVLHLAEYFAQRFGQRYGKAVSFDEAARTTMTAQAWPANVRELELVIERAVLQVNGQGVITPAELELPALSTPLAIAAGPFEPMHELERQHIFRAIDRARGNRTKAADLLGISVRTLRNKLHEYSAQQPAGKSAAGF